MKRHSTIAASLGLVGALAGGVACADLTSPDPLTGRYELQAIAGAALPVTIIDSGELYLAVSADTLHLQGNGTGTWVTHFRWHSLQQADTTFRYEVPVAVEFVDGQLRMRELPFCPPGADCAPPAGQVLHRQGSDLRHNGRYGEHRYERLGGQAP